MKQRQRPLLPDTTVRQRQRGAALLTAMVIVTLVATLAASMIWQQWRAVQVEAAERGRAQSYWVLGGALDWARLILKEDTKGDLRSGTQYDHLGEPWAVPLAEARLSSFLAADKDAATDDGPEAFLSGVITDEQARYNLRNLLDAAGKPVPEELQTLQMLCELVGVSPTVATTIVQGMAEAQRYASGADRSNAAAAPLMPGTLDQLSWLGIERSTITRLSPYVTLLPQPAPVNLNTASKEVIAAVIPGLNLATADRLVQTRQRQPFKQLTDAQALLPNPAFVLNASRVDVRSRYFEVRGRLRLDDRIVEERSLVQRGSNEIIALRRERIASVESARGKP
jgi:general secretion pathway protein K